MATLDTSFLVDLLRRRSRFHQRALDKLDELHARGESLATTRFTVAELLVGIELSNDPPRDHADVETLLADLDILDFDGLSARVFARLRAEHRRSGRIIVGDMDTLIAATSLAGGHALLVTRNPSDFAGIADLAVESY